MGLTRLSEASFLLKRFNNWKDATRVLVKHESSNFHKVATEALKANNDVAEMSKAAATEKKNKREYLLKVSIRFLGHQGLACFDISSKKRCLYRLFIYHFKAHTISNKLV